ncbi:MAG: cyclic nucleotide-binding domain-containing protein, partial [Bacteroidota bacterium]
MKEISVVLKSIKELSSGCEEEIHEIFNSLKKEKLEKGDFLLREGSVCTQYFFVESGSVRLFYVKDDVDYTVWIGTMGEVFTNLESYLNSSKSRISIQSIEPSVVYTIHKSQSDHLARKLNSYNTLLRKTVEIAFVNLSKNVISFQSEEAIERYKRVETEKNWISKYPLKYISTFIGVTQSSL